MGHEKQSGSVEKMRSREYQARFIQGCLADLRIGKAVLGVAPTGAGKGYMGAQIARTFDRVVVVAHRREIIYQWTKALKPHSCAWVGSIVSALRHGPKSSDLLIIDEAHRAAAKTYLEILAKYNTARILGLTATPLRTDGRGLCEVFQSIVEGPSIRDLITAGYLVPCRAFEAPDAALAALSRVKKVRGDYEPRELSKVMNRPRLVGNIVREYLKNSSGQRAVAFAVNVEHSRALEKAFLRKGIRAIHIDGRASEGCREAALRALAAGEIDVLCNVNLFTEGWDCPAVSCIIMARPTASLTLFLQSVGRGMRLCEGKKELIVLDHAGNIARHGYPDELPRDPWSLENLRQRAKREAEIAERERLSALGFDSIDAELEEKRRLQEETYLPKEIAALLGIRRTYLGQLLRKYQVVPARGTRGAFVRYRKLDIQELLNKWRPKGTCTAGQANRLLGLSNSRHVARLLKAHGVFAVQEGGRARYVEAEVRAVATGLAPLRDPGEYVTLQECASMLGVRRSAVQEILSNAGVHSVGRGGAARFKKSAIIALDRERRPTGSCSFADAASILGVKRQQCGRILKAAGVLPIAGRARSARYLQQDVRDVVARRINVGRRDVA